MFWNEDEGRLPVGNSELGEVEIVILNVLIARPIFHPSIFHLFPLSPHRLGQLERRQSFA